MAYTAAVFAIIIIGAVNPGAGLAALAIAGLWAWHDCR